MPNQLRLINEGVEQEITIAINNLLYEPNAVADLLQHLTERFPFTRLNITQGVWDALLSNKCDIAIGVPGSESLDSDMNTLFLAKSIGSLQLPINTHLPLLMVFLAMNNCVVTRPSMWKIPRKFYPNALHGYYQANEKSKCLI